MKSATERIRELVEWTNAQENRAVNRSSAQALAIYLARRDEVFFYGDEEVSTYPEIDLAKEDK